MSTCRVLREQGCQIAARTYRAMRSGHRGLSARTVTNAQTVEAIRQVAWVTDAHGRRRLASEGLYGRRKMLGYLRRGGLEVTAGSVDRGMRLLGLSGVVRGKPHRTTIADQAADRAPDLLNRDFTAKAPNLKWVTDFTSSGRGRGSSTSRSSSMSTPSGSLLGTARARKRLTWCQSRCGWRSGNETGRATPRRPAG